MSSELAPFDTKPIQEPETLDLNVSYPYDPEFEYHTRLVRLNLDKEREEDIKHDRGFVVDPTQGVKKTLKAHRNLKRRKPLNQFSSLKTLTFLKMTNLS